MLRIQRTNSEDQDFIKLVQFLDKDLAERDGNEHAFYHQFNKIDKIKHAIVIYDDSKPVGCGAMKKHLNGLMEIKRMYTPPDARGKGIATKVLVELEKWAIEISFSKCILETGKKQPEAIRLYEKNGYILIPNYGQYKGIENSLCFGKNLSSQ